MQNIPVFTTENGVASLTLKEIPYAKKAIAGIEKIIEQHRKTKPCKIFKKKMTRYEWELNQLYDRKRFWETRAGELEYEKKRLYP